MEPEVVITSSTHPTATWPHATGDCLSTSTPPCPTCYCYVCDVPIAQCDDYVTHAAADGKKNHWNVIKRRRNAFVNTWADIPALVNLIVSLSVEEAVRRTDRSDDTHDDVRFVTHALEQVKLTPAPKVDDVRFVTRALEQVKLTPAPKVDRVKIHAAQNVPTPVKTELH